MEENPENITSTDPDDGLSFVELELEALQSIYINEFEVKQGDDQKSTCVSIDLHPATADKPEEQYVKMTLKFTLSEEYPHAIPEISIRNPRGLSDEKITSTYQDLISIAEKKIGNSMLFEIIEAAKEHLTAGNRPCGECAICLYGFSESDVFFKTDCYHYFHSHCLARYAKNFISEKKEEDAKEDAEANNELLCPMCRVQIQFPGVDESYPPPSTGDDECPISEQILEMQKKMSDLYQKQLDKGGIIDVEAEKNKYLLEISNVPTLNAAEKADPVPEENDSSEKTDENTDSTSQSPQKNKSSNPKEAKESKSSTARTDEKFRQNKRLNKRGNHTPRTFPRKIQKPKVQDPCNEDHEEDSLGQGTKETQLDDVETGLPQNTDSSTYPNSHSKSSVGRGQRPGGYGRPRRDNYGGYNRGNYSRYPRNNTRGYGSNQRPHYDRNDQNAGRLDFGKDVSPPSDSSCTNKDASHVVLEDSKDSEHPENAPDSYKRHNDFDRRNKNRGRYPRNSPRGWRGNYSGNGSRGNYGRNRREDNYDGHREDTFGNNHTSDFGKDCVAAEVSTFCDEDPQNTSRRSYRNNPRRQSTGTHKESSRKGDDRHEADPSDNGTSSHKTSNQEVKMDSQRNVENNHSRNGFDSSESRDGRKYESHKSNQGHHSGRDHGRRNDYEENGRQHQRYDNYSQNRRNNPRDRFSHNVSTDKRDYQPGGRGRNNPHYRNRNAAFDGSQRRFQQDDGSFRNNRNDYRSAPRKSEERHYNASSQNGESRVVDEAQKSSNDVNNSKVFDPSSVKPFVPKDDSVVNDPELLSQKGPYPPPGFNNPLKKVVYGLEAAKPPPGFPRR